MEEKNDKNIELIKKAKLVHGDKYDYSNFNYVNAKTRVCIICPEHGEFWQRVDHHMNGSGCPKCAGVALLSFEEFVDKAHKKHNNKFTYIKESYTKTANKVAIICPYHGEFYQNASSHLSGCGCPSCNGGVGSTKDIFIEKAVKVHGKYYDYSKIKYTNAKSKICIICPRHGEFWQEADSHLYGKGCPKCKSSVLENMVINELNKNQIFYEYQFKLKELGKKSYDFCIPEINLIIECQGEQHFTPVNFSNNNDANNSTEVFNKRVALDREKFNIATKNDFEIAYFFIPKFFKNQSVNVDLEFYKDKRIFNHTEDLLYYINSQMDKKDDTFDNQRLFMSDLFSITPNIIFQDDAFTYNDYKIYLIKCNPNERDSLNSVRRVNKKRKYKSIFIFEDEWINNRELIKSKLKHILNISNNNNNNKIGARKTQIRVIDKDVERNFLENYHIQGCGQSTVALGAYYKDELIGVMSFKKLSNNKKDYDLTRFATNYNYVCQGLGSKMLSYFINEYSATSIISFADKRWTVDKDNNLYTKLGFLLEYEIYPDYKYFNRAIDRYKRYHKFNFRKESLHIKYGLDLHMTEREMVRTLGYERIWDCGLLKYKLVVKQKESN